MASGFDYSGFIELQRDLDRFNLGREEFIKSCAKELAARLLRKVIKRTPVGIYNKPVHFYTKDGREVSFTPHTGKVGGTLRRGWTNGKRAGAAYAQSLPIRQSGNTYVIEIVNNVKYAHYVEYGHRTRNGGWAEGRFMLSLSEIEIQNTAPAILQMKLERQLKELFG